MDVQYTEYIYRFPIRATCSTHLILHLLTFISDEEKNHVAPHLQTSPTWYSLLVGPKHSAPLIPHSQTPSAYVPPSVLRDQGLLTN